MRKLGVLFANNRRWAQETEQRTPGFFSKLAQQQRPEYLWIGCADSRVPANEIVGLLPGELFVHRNVANLVIHTDFNCLSVIQYAVDILQVKHIIICGHYGCGGVRAALSDERHGLIDNWLRHLKDIRHEHEARLQALADETARVDLLCELNVLAQVKNVCQNTIVQAAWQRGQALAVHGWIYSIQNGLLKDLDVCIENEAQFATVYGRS